MNFYRPHPKDGEGNVFSLSTLGGGVPVSHNALQHFPECHGAAGGGGVPCQVQPGGVPCQVQPGGVPCQVQLGGGYPARSSRGGTLPGPAGGVPWPGGYPAGGGTQLEQHREYLLHGGRYASCVHAGGLSCTWLIWVILFYSIKFHFHDLKFNPSYQFSTSTVKQWEENGSNKSNQFLKHLIIKVRHKFVKKLIIISEI